MNTCTNIGKGGGYPYRRLLGLLESEKHNLGMGSHAQRRAPRAGAPIREDKHPAEAIQAMDIGTIDSGRNPGAWREIPSSSAMGSR
jgi:hypothetical protein